MNMSKGKLLMAMGMILVLFGTFAPFALSITGGTLYISVKTSEGAPIEGATVELVSVNWIQAGIPPILVELHIMGTTDSTGKTSFGSTIDGTYTITASMSEFDSSTKTATVTAGSSATVNFVLEGGPPPPPPPEPPDGYWTIDKYTGIEENDIVYIPYEQLPIEYICTAGADQVQKVVVKIFDADGVLLEALELTQQDGSRWGTVYDLPEGQGVYIVEGYVTSGAGTFRSLTIFGDSEGATLKTSSNLFVYGGIAVFVVGFIVESRSEKDE